MQKIVRYAEKGTRENRHEYMWLSSVSSHSDIFSVIFYSFMMNRQIQVDIS